MSPSVSVRLLLTQSDARLVELTHAGHERAFEALVERYRRQLLGYCRRQLLSHERAEDALQQGLLQAWLALRQGTEVRDVKPWLYSIVHNTALNLRRSGYDYAQLSETLRGADAPPEDLDRRIAVREALAGLAALPEMQRQALLRTAVDGSSYQETATMLGLSEGAVRGLVHRARVALRTATTALTPSPLLSWLLGTAGDAPLASRLTEVGAGDGAAGLAAGLLKIAATAATAGVVVGSIGISRDARDARSRHPDGATHATIATRAAAGTTASTAASELALSGDRVAADIGVVGSAPEVTAHRPPGLRLDHSNSGASWRSHRRHRHLTFAAATPPPSPAVARPPAPSQLAQSTSSAVTGLHSAGSGSRWSGTGDARGGGAKDGVENQQGSDSGAESGVIGGGGAKADGGATAHNQGSSDGGQGTSSTESSVAGNSSSGNGSQDEGQHQGDATHPERGQNEGQESPASSNRRQQEASGSAIGVQHHSAASDAQTTQSGSNGEAELASASDRRHRVG